MGCPMLPYLQRGSFPPKRHTRHAAQPGFKKEGIYYEEVVTLAGFGRAYTICYHLRPPTRVAKIEAAGTVSLDMAPEPTLRHHHVKTKNMKAQGDPITGRVPLFVNDDLVLGRCRPAVGAGNAFPQRFGG